MFTIKRSNKENRRMTKTDKPNLIKEIIDKYIDDKNMDWDDFQGLKSEIKDHLKYIDDNPSEYFEPGLTQDDIDHATKYGYNPT